MVREKIIKKTKEFLRLPPNLLDYQKTYQNFSWKNAEKEIAWLPGKKINIAYNALDWPLKQGLKNKIALFWEGESGEEKSFTYYQLYLLSNKFANFLKSLGVKKGERVFFFLPRVPELYWGFLGTLKTGAIGGTLFAAFGQEALLQRLKNIEAKVVVTNRKLLSRLEKIKKNLPKLEKIVLVEELPKILSSFSDEFKPQPMEPTDPCFILFTSATGRTPVCGITIPQSAFIQQYQTAKWVLDLKQDDVYWCTADPGWVTGLVYGILTPWALGVTQVVFEGRFDAKKWFWLIEKYKVSVFYTAPTALRMLRVQSLNDFDLSSLRHICSVGEALDIASLEWALKNLNLPIHDTWWQTETGAIMIANFPCLDIKPGSMGKPVPGIKAEIVDDEGKILPPGEEGNLAFKPGWPSMMIKVWRNKKRYKSYFRNGWYFSGDRAWKDKDGYFWFLGRADDIIKTSGERISPVEVESSLLEHPAVLETGVIGKPDPLRGEIIKAFIVLKNGWLPSEKLKEEIKNFVKTHLAGHAYPREIEFVEKLPKNRSGKIVRRILKAKELGLPLGDTSTLE